MGSKCIDDYELVPGYHEWHLVDKSNPDVVLYNIVDPLENLYHETGEPLTHDEVVSFVAGDISCAEWKWSEGDDYNGVEDPGDLLPPFAAEVIADGLYRYYLA